MMVQEAFQQALNDLGIEVDHNVFGCKDCRWVGWDVVYCPKSQHHRDHPFHECPGMGQECC